MNKAQINVKTKTQKDILAKLLKAMGYSPYTSETIDYSYWQAGDLPDKQYQGTSGAIDSGKLFQFNELDQFIDYISAPQTFKIKLNDDYTAIITKDSPLIEVGCQKFDIGTIKYIVEEYNRLNRQ